jgi:hypothetical protein
MAWMIVAEDDAWVLEERFWLEGLPFHERHLVPECLMALPGMGVMRAGEIPKSLRDTPQHESLQWNTQRSAISLDWASIDSA